jgi:hypothetical protein
MPAPRSSDAVGLEHFPVGPAQSVSRSSPRPAYASGFGGFGLGPPKLQRRRKAGTQFFGQGLDARFRGHERSVGQFRWKAL